MLINTRKILGEVHWIKVCEVEIVLCIILRTAKELEETTKHIDVTTDTL